MAAAATEKVMTCEAAAKLPPRERILATARELFYRQGIRAVGVEAVAEAAGTNKMTLYRHFASKDELVAECMRQFAAEVDAWWDELEGKHAGNPRALLSEWLHDVGACVADPEDRGCALVNAAVELPEKHHPARCVIEQFKKAQRERLVRLCEAAGAKDAALLADELFLLIEGARVCSQSLGPAGPSARVVRMGEVLIDSHLK
ncbi:MAG: TetR/AcrR family transcriptional regulator [Variibacter sp.]